MARFLKIVLLSIMLSASVDSPSYAGPHEDARDAYQRGDYAVAPQIWRALADKGSAAGQFNVGRLYEYGEGVPHDNAQAARWYRKAADQGLAIAQHTLGLMYFEARLGQEDHAAALWWFRKAAEQEFADAQFQLGAIHLLGLGVREDFAEAARWYRRAAIQGLFFAQPVLGGLYESGQGVLQDFVQAHMWYNISGMDILRDRIARRMTAGQVAEAQRLARLWYPVLSESTALGSEQLLRNEKVIPPEPSLSSTGSGFVVTQDGHLLTNSHVVKDCKVVQVRRADGEVTDARVVATSPRDDLALLKVPQRQTTVATFRGGRPVKQGEGVTVYGFPLTGLLASTGNLTFGHITALSGPHDDARLLQISAAVQQGNSGGPVLDSGGNVVAMIVSKLDALAVAGATGDMPQNINFAIKASVATNFLEARGISYAIPVPSPDLAASNIADRARAITMRVDCLK